MLSFFKKSKIEPDTIIFGLKYNLPIINGSSVFVLYKHYYINHLERLPEILTKSFYFGINAEDLKYLPNNINNKDLELRIWGYEGEKLPENWNIEQLTASFTGNPRKQLPKTFKPRKILNRTTNETIFPQDWL
jgi:hypothetical protein